MLPMRCARGSSFAPAVCWPSSSSTLPPPPVAGMAGSKWSRGWSSWNPARLWREEELDDVERVDSASFDVLLLLLLLLPVPVPLL